MLGLTWSNCIDLGIHNEMKFLENLTTFNRKHQAISEKTKLLKMIQSSKTYLFNLSWHWIAPQDNGMYIQHDGIHWDVSEDPIIVDTLDIKQPSLQLVIAISHKKNDKREVSSHDLQEGSFQSSHFRISNGHSNTINMLPKILLLFSSSLERHGRPCLLHSNLYEMLIPYLGSLSSMHDAQLVWKSSCTMECSFALSIWETSYACLGSPYWQFGLFRQRTWFQQFE